MRLLAGPALAALVGLAAGCGPAGRGPAFSPVPGPQVPARMTAVEVAGKTQPVPSRRGIIAPVVQHPVIAVLVAPGDPVKKGQPLIKLDADEPEADVRAKKATLEGLQAGLARLKAEPRQLELEEAEAALESQRITAKEARATFEDVTRVWEQGATSEQHYRDARAALARSAADERAGAARLARLRKRPLELEIAEAEAKVAVAAEELKSAEAELEHYTLTAPIDGVVSRLDVSPGAVPRPGRTVWGDILDLSEIDVRCDLTPEQAEVMTVGQAVTVHRDGRPDARCTGRVVWVGLDADPDRGRVPVLARLTNPGGRLPSGVPVRVHFCGPSAP